MHNEPSLKAQDLDYMGAMFGMRFLDDIGAPKGCIALYLEDDESWHYVCTFNHFWVNDLVQNMVEARLHYNKIAESATDVKAIETRPVPEVRVN